MTMSERERERENKKVLTYLWQVKSDCQPLDLIGMDGWKKVNSNQVTLGIT